ncbi:hypothetical protein Ciccas_005506 [Cichlidogyrus casuarinus]|uniref:Uncharacterized protein n=1 Tax=Cichlidogyrus casuarinus TaxID=1844966 RepID=A0ABD2Q8F6_9PLAT
MIINYVDSSVSTFPLKDIEFTCRDILIADLDTISDFINPPKPSIVTPTIQDLISAKNFVAAVGIQVADLLLASRSVVLYGLNTTDT